MSCHIMCYVEPSSCHQCGVMCHVSYVICHLSCDLRVSWSWTCICVRSGITADTVAELQDDIAQQMDEMNEMEEAMAHTSIADHVDEDVISAEYEQILKELDEGGAGGGIGGEQKTEHPSIQVQPVTTTQGSQQPSTPIKESASTSTSTSTSSPVSSPASVSTSSSRVVIPS